MGHRYFRVVLVRLRLVSVSVMSGVFLPSIFTCLSSSVSGVVSLDPPREPPYEVLDLPWETVLCCASPPASAREGRPGDRGSGGVTSYTGPPHTPPCHFWNSTSTTQPPLEADPSRGKTPGDTVDLSTRYCAFPLETGSHCRLLFGPKRCFFFVCVVFPPPRMILRTWEEQGGANLSTLTEMHDSKPDSKPKLLMLYIAYHFIS